jgi:hypothetical protein
MCAERLWLSGSREARTEKGSIADRPALIKPVPQESEDYVVKIARCNFPDNNRHVTTSYMPRYSGRHSAVGALSQKYLKTWYEH